MNHVCTMRTSLKRFSFISVATFQPENMKSNLIFSVCAMEKVTPMWECMHSPPCPWGGGVLYHKRFLDNYDQQLISYVATKLTLIRWAHPPPPSPGLLDFFISHYIPHTVENVMFYIFEIVSPCAPTIIRSMIRVHTVCVRVCVCPTIGFSIIHT